SHIVATTQPQSQAVFCGCNVATNRLLSGRWRSLLNHDLRRSRKTTSCGCASRPSRSAHLKTPRSATASNSAHGCVSWHSARREAFRRLAEGREAIERYNWLAGGTRLELVALGLACPRSSHLSYPPAIPSFLKRNIVIRKNVWIVI